MTEVIDAGQHQAETGEKGLRSGTLGLLSSVVIGLASTAPAYSLAATLGFVVVALEGGKQAPAIMILAFIPMICIAYAYQELNKEVPDCGTTFTWAAKAFGPRAGWLGGWGIIVADIIVMANLAQIAGQYGFLLIGSDNIAANKWWVALAGCVWIAVMTWICYIGIEVSAKLQYALLGVEIVVLSIFSVTALTKVYGHHAPVGSIHPALSWFNPMHITSFKGFTTAILLAIFIYWGWDTAVSVNEETADSSKIPGRAAVISTLVLVGTYLLVTVAAQAYAGTGDTGIGLANADNSGDVLSILGKAVLGSGVAKVLIFMVLTSAAASTLTTILPTARTSLSMAAFKAAPSHFARIHPKYLTPTWSTVVMGGVSIIFYVGLTILSDSILADTIGSIGLAIAFYYGLTGFACVWWFRKRLTTSFRDFVLRGLLPFAGGLMLLAAFVESAKNMYASDYGNTSFHGIGGVFILGIGSLLLGVVMMFIWQLFSPDYFRGRTLNAATNVVVLDDGTLDQVGVGTPDSPQRQHTVLPPDELDGREDDQLDPTP
ncbi:MAG: amino acid transporter [Acidimicrobiales bacterium]|nr:amino acid transporter [Acidimicrobiales bacterium]